MNFLSEINTEGFTIIDNVYTENEIEKLISLIENITENDSNNVTFRKTQDLFAIRQFHKEIPETLPYIFNQNLKDIIECTFGEGYFITKSIYFDKPEKSNWFVAYHQDLTISVDKKIEIENFENWTIKQNQFAVQPPTKILEPVHPNDVSTKVLLEYNLLLKNDPRVETVLLPIRDGLTVSRVL